MYLTYDEYINMGGDVVEETAFDNLEFEARSVIDWWTFNRLQNEESYPDSVKRCMYKLISLINEQQKAIVVNPKDFDGNVIAGIASESNDGVSTSYNTLSAREAVETIQDQLKTTVQMFLQGVRNSLGHKLLYRGIYPNE